MFKGNLVKGNFLSPGLTHAIFPLSLLLSQFLYSKSLSVISHKFANSYFQTFLLTT